VGDVEGLVVVVDGSEYLLGDDVTSETGLALQHVKRSSVQQQATQPMLTTVQKTFQ